MPLDELNRKRSVSIVVFYRNVGSEVNKTISEILCALKELALIEFQIILVDDGSDKINSSNLANFQKGTLVQSLLSVGAYGAMFLLLLILRGLM
jgi:hypothetical protein